MTQVLLAMQNITKTFTLSTHVIRAVDDISFDLLRGECLAIVGESGSGKSTIANMILGIYPPSGGTISYEGILLPDKRTLAHRRNIQLVQQNPLSSLNPKRTIGASLRLALDVHNIGERATRNTHIGKLLEEVGLPAEYAERAPASLSGGQRQRVAIARALACESNLVVLDEPTSALDVLVQARVLKLLEELRKKRDLTYIFITHDLCVVRNIADRVAVFNKGRMIELNDTGTLFEKPIKDYTKHLLGTIPVITGDEDVLRQKLAGETDA